MRLYDLEVVTPERIILQEPCSFLILRSLDGEIGVLGGHTPLITGLVPTPVDLRLESGRLFVAVSGGFLEVRPDKVTLLARTAERAEEIDLARAEAARERAQALLDQAPPGADLPRAQAALKRALARLKTVEMAQALNSPV